MLYLKNIKNPYNLQNYLRRKNINIGDWLRACYYFVYRELGLTNRWRYDEYVFKPTIYYNWEKIKYAHLLAKDRKQLYLYLDQIELSPKDLFSFFVWFMWINDINKINFINNHIFVWREVECFLLGGGLLLFIFLSCYLFRLKFFNKDDDVIFSILYCFWVFFLFVGWFLPLFSNY